MGQIRTAWTADKTRVVIIIEDSEALDTKDIVSGLRAGLAEIIADHEKNTGEIIE